MTATEKQTPARLTKADLLRLLEPYGPGEEVVFVTFEGGVTVHEEVEVAKDHSTTRTEPDGSTTMPVAIYLVDGGKRGEPGVMGVKDRDLPGVVKESIERAGGDVDEVLDFVGRRGEPQPGGPTAFTDLLWDLLRDARQAHADGDRGHYLFDFGERAGGVREVGAFLDGRGRRGLSVRTGNGDFLLFVEPRTE